LLPPGLEGGLVALPGTRHGLLPGPVPLSQQATDGGGRVGDTKRAADHFPHPLERPAVAAEAEGGGSLAEQRRDAGLLLGRQPGLPTGARAVVERALARLSGLGEPLADGSLADTESESDLPLGPAVLEQLPRAQASPLSP
jgi:hypothetical protein